MELKATPSKVRATMQEFASEYDITCAQLVLCMSKVKHFPENCAPLLWPAVTDRDNVDTVLEVTPFTEKQVKKKKKKVSTTLTLVDKFFDL